MWGRDEDRDRAQVVHVIHHLSEGDRNFLLRLSKIVIGALRPPSDNEGEVVLLQKVLQNMSKFSDEIAELTEQAAATSSGISAVKTLIEGLLAQVEENAGDEEALQAIVATGRANLQALAEAAQSGVSTPPPVVEAPSDSSGSSGSSSSGSGSSSSSSSSSSTPPEEPTSPTSGVDSTGNTGAVAPSGTDQPTSETDGSLGPGVVNED